MQWLLRLTIYALICVATFQLDVDEKFLSGFCNVKEMTCGDRKNNTATIIPPSVCSCDEDCYLFGECCADVVFQNKKNESLNLVDSIHGIPRNYWGCHGLQENKMVWMVMKCPSDANALMSKRCEATVDSDLNYHYTMDVPVLSNRSGIWYRNIYCAICNGEDGQLAHIKYSIFCQYNYTKEQAFEVIGNGNYSEPVSWKYINGQIRTCSLKAVPMSEVPKRFEHKCGIKSQTSRGLKSIATWKIPIDSCLSNWTDHDTVQKCKAYSLHSKQKSIGTIGNSANDIVLPQVYKNPHCAICNEVPLETITCFIPGSGEDRIRASVSLEIVMNFMESEEDTEEIRICQPPKGTWDGLHKKCINLVYAMNYTEVMNNRYDVTLNLTCPTTTLKSLEFAILKNKSIQFTLKHSHYTGRIFNEFVLLNNGSAVVCIPNDVKEDAFISGTAQEYLTTFCLSISVICLILHIGTYCALPKLCNLPGKNLLSLSWALLFAHLILMLGVRPIVEVPHGICVFIAVLEHFCFLAAFFWMNIMSVDIWRTFSVSTIRDTAGIKTHRKYSAYAWGSSVLISLVALIVDLSTDDGAVKPSFGKNQLCWFGKQGGLGLFLTLPMFVLIVANMYFFINTVHKIWQTRRQGVSYIRDKARAELIQTSSRYSNDVKSSIKSHKMPAGVTGRKDQARCYLYLKLFTIMGLTWIFGFIAALANVSFLWYPFIILNGLQGAFIFVMFDVKRNIANMLWDKYISKHGYEPPGFLTITRSSTTKTSDTTKSTSSLNGKNRATAASRTFSSSSNSVL